MAQSSRRAGGEVICCEWWGWIRRPREGGGELKQLLGRMQGGRAWEESGQDSFSGAESFQETPPCSYRPLSQPQFLPRSCTPRSSPLSRRPLSAHPSLKRNQKVCGPSRMDPRFSWKTCCWWPGNGAPDVILPQRRCPPRETHSLKGWRKQWFHGQ